MKNETKYINYIFCEYCHELHFAYPFTEESRKDLFQYLTSYRNQLLAEDYIELQKQNKLIYKSFTNVKIIKEAYAKIPEKLNDILSFIEKSNTENIKFTIQEWVCENCLKAFYDEAYDYFKEKYGDIYPYNISKEKNQYNKQLLEEMSHYFTIKYDEPKRLLFESRIEKRKNLLNENKKK